MAQIPQLGVGIQHVPSLASWLPSTSPVDVFEILLDNLMGPLDSPFTLQPGAEEYLDRSSNAVLVAHSNYGGEHGFGPMEQTAAVRRHVPLARMFDSPWVSNHCFYADQTWADIWSSPIQWSRAEVKRLAPRMRALQELYGRPLLHENPAFYFPTPGSDLSDAEFLAMLVDAAGTYIHLDLHNIYANSLNLPGYRCEDFLATIPMDRVIAIHMAGGGYGGRFYHDWHDRKSPEPVWEMLEQVLSAARVCAVIFEYRVQEDDDIPLQLTPEELLGEIGRAQALWDRIYGPGSRHSTRGEAQGAHGR